MEESLNHLRDHFPLEEKEIRTYSALSFAYIGDAVFDLVIRTMMVTKGNVRTNKYHKKVTGIVNAASQTRMAERILPCLSEEETTIFRRGKNAKPMSMAKNQSRHDYRIATAYETLIGYLYLTGRMDRIIELVEMGLEEE